MIRLRILIAVAIVSLGLGVVPNVAMAVPTVFTVEAQYLAAIALIDATAVFGLEDFNSSAVGFLGAGPTMFTGFDLTLNAIGNNGSFTGVINPGDFDGSNALQGRVVDDTADFELFPGFFLLGEGVQSMDFAFSTAVIGFAADWNSTTTNDGVAMTVNGTQFDLGDHLPNNNLNDGDGFFGIVDASLISSFSLFPDNLDVSATFEEFELDDLQFATPGTGGPGGAAVPEPSTLLLFGTGMLGLIGYARRRKKLR